MSSILTKSAELHELHRPDKSACLSFRNLEGSNCSQTSLSPSLQGQGRNFTTIYIYIYIYIYIPSAYIKPYFSQQDTERLGNSSSKHSPHNDR